MVLPHRRIQRASRATTYPRLYTAALLCASLMLAAAPQLGCSGADRRGDQAEPELTPYDQLYRAIVGETAARGWEVAVESSRYRTLTTGYVAAGEGVRKRRTMRVVVLPRGAALKVVVEHERQTGEQWAPAEDKALAAQAREEELEIGRAIERRFHRLR